ncbi:DNA modification methylase [Archangium sp. Cb G35]|uniref:DNA methyltransferase n=1 Tax=Archangium sp. Cb G35 TaxID=1920190 RepID=UPI000937D665|nr:DNA methyltransferase [Archangium sp. Cb G35]OJT24465.1 DNA modification methylase [Archangium sp. Cb G35]
MSVDALNAVCPYYTMYPLDFPLAVLKRHGKPGEWVIDPFCGRGTTNFAARLLGMPSVGVDSSPVAAALAKAKLVYASPGHVVASARAILNAAKEPADVPSGRFWKLAYHRKTLVELCHLREELLKDCTSPTRVLLRAIVLGALHGPRPKGKPSYFSNQSPRTFAPKPNYAVKFWTERNLRPDAVDVLSIIKARAERYLAEPPPDVEGMVQLADSRDADTFSNVPKASWVVTSPPYYGMRTYLPDQWLRLWFLGGPDYVEYRQPEAQLEHTGAMHFSAEMARVWTNVAKRAASDARLIIRFGGIHDRDAEPMDVLRNSLADTGWVMKTARRVPDADTGRRQVRQFQAAPKKSIAEYDAYCRLA